MPYPMNFRKFSHGKLNKFDQIIKTELREENMMGKQASDQNKKNAVGT